MRANDAGWGSFEVIGSLAAGVALAIAFVAWELRAREPMLAMRLFAQRSFSAGNAAIFFTFASLFSCVFLFAQFLQTSLGYGPLDAGLRLIPWTITFILVAPAAGALADRIGERPLMLGGLLLQTVGLVWIAVIADPVPAYSQLVVPFVVAGVGVSLAIPSAQNAVVGGVEVGELGKAAGANSMMRELGGVFGIAVVVAVFAAVGGYSSAATFAHGLAAAVGVAAGLSLAGALVALALPRAPDGGRRDRRRAGARGEELTVRRTVVRYRVKPQFVDLNVELVQAVYEELREADPPGFRYATFQLDDEVSFVHVAISESDPPPLPGLEAFRRFQRGIAERCDEPPVVSEAREVGSFRVRMRASPAVPRPAKVSRRRSGRPPERMRAGI